MTFITIYEINTTNFKFGAEVKKTLWKKKTIH